MFVFFWAVFWHSNVNFPEDYMSTHFLIDHKHVHTIEENINIILYSYLQLSNWHQKWTHTHPVNTPCCASSWNNLDVDTPLDWHTSLLAHHVTRTPRDRNTTLPWRFRSSAPCARSTTSTTPLWCPREALVMWVWQILFIDLLSTP